MKFTNFGKKLLAFVAVAVLGLILVSCNGGNKEKEQHQANVNAVLDSIIFDETLLSEVKGNLTFVQKNNKYPDVKIEWTTSELDIVDAQGKVTRPALDDPRIKEGTEYVEVTGTVKASQGEAQGTKDFVFCVYGEPKMDVSNVQAIKKSFYALVQQEGMKYSDPTSEMAISAEITGEVVIKISKGIFVNDGTGVVYVYGSTDANVGDTVKVSGNVYAFYGLIEFGSSVNIEKVADKEVAAPVFKETTVSEYTAALDAALDAEGKIVDVDAFVPFSCGALKLYAKVEKGNKGSGDTYYLADPYTGKSVAIYHYTTENHTATLDALVGKYVYANVYAYDTHSALVDRYRVVWDGSEMVEAPTPELSDAQKVANTLAGLVLDAKVTADVTLPVVEGVVWSLKEEYAAAKIENGVLKVTRPENGQGNATVVVVATATFGAESGSKEFTVEVVEKEDSGIKEVTEFDAEKTYKLGFYQGNLAQYRFVTGVMDGYYGATTDNPASAADVKVVVVEGGYQLMVGNKYLELTQSGTYTNVAFVEASTGFVWTYNEEYNTFVHDFAGTEYYVGSYKEYSTLSASQLSYANGSFPSHLYEVSGSVQPDPIKPVEGTKYTAKYAGGTTTNFDKQEASNASLLGLSDDLFTVTGTKAGSNMPGLNKDGTLRIYAAGNYGGSPYDANKVTFDIKEGTIKQITITCTQNADMLVVLVNGVEVEGVNGVYNINASSFTITNDGTAQIRISSIEIIA